MGSNKGITESVMTALRSILKGLFPWNQIHGKEPVMPSF